MNTAEGEQQDETRGAERYQKTASPAKQGKKHAIGQGLAHDSTA